MLRQDQISNNERYKFMQLIIEERKFKAETEWEERKIGIIEQGLTIRMEKLKAETEQEHLILQ